MPNRIIREGWVESEAVDQLDCHAERFFLRLCLRADDFGRYSANPTLLKSSLYPLKDDVRSTDIPRLTAACEKAGLLRCYEVGGKGFLEIAKFDQRMRAKRSKFPAPDGHLSDMRQTNGSHPRTESESETETETETEGAGHQPPCPVVALWNRTWETHVHETASRKKTIAARLRQEWRDVDWQKAMAAARESAFCCGKNDRGWTADIDWFLKPDTAAKLLEGKYAHGKAPPNQNGAAPLKRLNPAFVPPDDSWKPRFVERHPTPMRQEELRELLAAGTLEWGGLYDYERNRVAVDKYPEAFQ